MRFTSIQRRIINSKPKGHSLLKGIEGAGKTTTVVHRIPVLFSKFCVDKNDRILMVSFNKKSLEYISSIYKNLNNKKYHQNSFFDEDNKDKLEMNSIDSLLLSYFNKYRKSYREKLEIASYVECANELNEAINIVAKRYEKVNIIDIKYVEFIKEEIRWIKACNYKTLEQYQISDRLGRSSSQCSNAPKFIRRNSKQRQAIYEILLQYNNNLNKINKIDTQDMEVLALEESKKKGGKKYTHIIIDDVQKFTKVQLEFLKAIYNEKSYSSITFVLDVSKSIYENGWISKNRSFATLGYDMKGKSTFFRKSYIEEICKNIKSVKVKNKLINHDNFVDLSSKRNLAQNQITINELLEKSIISKNIGKSNIKTSFILDTIEYIDLKRKVSHKFIKDSYSADEIYTDYDGFEEKVKEIRKIPVFNEIAAGSPILMNDSFQENYYLPKEWIGSSKNVFMLKVKGDSMINKNIYNGDYVVINKQNTVNIGDIVAVDIEGESTLKTYKVVDGKVILMPENDKYEPIILDGQEFSVLGIAIGLIKN